MAEAKKHEVEFQLLKLIEHYGSRVRVSIFGYQEFLNSNGRNNEKPKSTASPSGRFDVEIAIFETKEEDQFSKAMATIEKGRQILEDADLEIIHKSNHPNFFQSLQAKVDIIRNQIGANIPSPKQSNLDDYSPF